MNRGGVGARSLNIELQAALNPAGERKVERFGWTFAPGDKVMQIENDYDKEVYNGDIGYVEDVDPEAGELTASFDGRSVTYGFGELDTLVPAYAATIHKSQGSEYPAVVIPIMTQHYAMLQRNLLYTGITRGKRLVVLVGQKKAVAIAVTQRLRPAALVEARRVASTDHARCTVPNGSAVRDPTAGAAAYIVLSCTVECNENFHCCACSDSAVVRSSLVLRLPRALRSSACLSCAPKVVAGFAVVFSLSFFGFRGSRLLRC